MLETTALKVQLITNQKKMQTLCFCNQVKTVWWPRGAIVSLKIKTKKIKEK